MDKTIIVVLAIFSFEVFVVILAYLAINTIRNDICKISEELSRSIAGCRERLEFIIAGVTKDGFVSREFLDYLEFANKYVDIDQINRGIKGKIKVNTDQHPTSKRQPTTKFRRKK